MHVPTPPKPAARRTVRVAALLALALLLVAAGAATAGSAGDAGARWPVALQADAPAYNSAAFEVIDHGVMSATATVAWQGVLDEGLDRSAITLSVTPAVFTRLRRGARPGVAARVTVGGPLQFYDARHAPRAGRLTNHVTSDLKVRLGAAGPSARRLRFTATLTADNFATGYGLDRYGTTLIAEREGRCMLTANAGFRLQERYHAPVRYQEAKLGAGAAYRLRPPGGPVRALDVGVAGGCLVRNRHRPDVWQGSVRLDAPLGGRLRASASARFSDLSEVRGADRRGAVLGLACDLGPARR